MDEARARRVTRSTVAAVVTVLLAVAAHGAGGGTLPSWPALLPVVAIVARISYVLADRPLPRWQIITLLGTAQLAVHLLVTLTAHGGHAETGPVMVACHILGTAATALVLAHAEHLWWRLRSWWYRRRRPVRHCPPATAPIGHPLPRYEPLRTVPRAGAVGMRAPPRAVLR